MRQTALAILRRDHRHFVTFTITLWMLALLCVSFGTTAYADEAASGSAAQARTNTNEHAARSGYTQAERDMQHFVRKTGNRIIKDAGVVGMSVAIVDQGKVILVDGFGHTSIARKEKVTHNTVFRLASLSKSFAGTLTAMLVGENVFQWDDKVIDYAPFFRLKDPNGAGTVTIRDLLSHRVGLPYNTHDKRIEKDEPYELLVRELDQVDMMCPASDCYAYQNVAFSMIGDIVFASTGDFYSHQVQKKLFSPLNMRTASFGKDGLTHSASWAQPHVWKGQGWHTVPPLPTYYRMPPAAGVNASAKDMAQWMLAHLGHMPSVVSPTVLNDVQKGQVFTKDQLKTRGWRTRLLTASYGTGWRIFDYSGKKMVYHAGAVQGYRIMTALLPEYDFGVTVMWNCNTYVPSGFMPMIVDKKLGMPASDWLELDVHAARMKAAKAKKPRKPRRRRRR